MRLVWKLLKRHISIPQFCGFLIANIVGMTIILLGVQFYNDIQAVYNSEDSFMREDFLIVNKQVGTLSTITGKDNSFTESELSDFKSQPFVTKFGVFTPSTFRVRAGFDIEGMTNFSTDMFFESVPDEFVDVDKSEWLFHENDHSVPIIIPKYYLDLYNFGFAQSRNLPKLSEGVLEAISIEININGNGEADTYEGALAGFSNRINTILVPESFIDYANMRFSGNNTQSVSRVILQVDDPTDERITKYLQDNGYETDEGKLDASKTNYLLKVLLSVVLLVGLVISILAFYILMLSIFLLVEKNSTKLENLLLIGYSPTKVSQPYQILTILLNVIVVLVSVITVLVIRKMYLRLFEDFFPNMETPSTSSMWIIAIGLCVFVSVVNFFVIKRKVLSIWRSKK